MMRTLLRRKTPYLKMYTCLPKYNNGSYLVE